MCVGVFCCERFASANQQLRALCAVLIAMRDFDNWLWSLVVVLSSHELYIHPMDKGHYSLTALHHLL